MAVATMVPSALLASLVLRCPAARPPRTPPTAQTLCTTQAVFSHIAYNRWHRDRQRSEISPFSPPSAIPSPLRPKLPFVSSQPPLPSYAGHHRLYFSFYYF